MRPLPLALAIAAAVHGAAVGYVSTLPLPKHKKPEQIVLTPIEVVPPAAAEPSPTEVTLLEDDTVVVPARVASSRSNTRRGKTQQITTTATATIETRASRDNPPPAENPLMRMRHPEPPQLDGQLSGEFWARFEANTKPLQPKEIASEQRAFELATAEGNLKNPRWIANASPEQVAMERANAAALRDAQAHAELKPDGEGTKADHHTFKARFNPDGTVRSIDDKRNLRAEKIPLKGEFDITDAMMRSQGIDPYSSYKLKVLDETRDERAAIGKRYRTQQLAQSKQHMQRNLERLWQTTTELRARKRGLFELWDDCAETGSDELVTGGASAREYLIGFIRSKLPAGSTEAFTSAELAHFNKRRKSRATFSPYESM